MSVHSSTIAAAPMHEHRREFRVSGLGFDAKLKTLNRKPQ
jgi:hypothetical protein